MQFIRLMIISFKLEHTPSEVKLDGSSFTQVFKDKTSVNCLGFRIIQPFSSLALQASNDIPMYIIHESRHLMKKVRNKIEFEEVRNANNFPFNH